MVAYWGISLYTHHGETITVPNVVGQKVNAAAAKLEGLNLCLEVVDTTYNKTKPDGVIVSQTVMPNRAVKAGRVVGVVINSTSAKMIPMPDIGGNCSYNEARARLIAMGFKLGDTEYITGDAEWVYSVKANGKAVPAGTRVSIETPIILVVGDGNVIDEFNGDTNLDAAYFGANGDTLLGTDPNAILE